MMATPFYLRATPRAQEEAEWLLNNFKIQDTTYDSICYAHGRNCNTYPSTPPCYKCPSTTVTEGKRYVIIEVRSEKCKGKG